MPYNGFTVLSGIKNPRGKAKHRAATDGKMMVKPTYGFCFVKLGKSAPDRIFTGNTGHAKQFRIYSVSANRGDMGVPFMSGKDRQKQGAQDITDFWCVRAAVLQWAAGNKGFI